MDAVSYGKISKRWVLGTQAWQSLVSNNKSLQPYNKNVLYVIIVWKMINWPQAEQDKQLLYISRDPPNATNSWSTSLNFQIIIAGSIPYRIPSNFVDPPIYIYTSCTDSLEVQFYFIFIFQFSPLPLMSSWQSDMPQTRCRAPQAMKIFTGIL